MDKEACDAIAFMATILGKSKISGNWMKLHIILR